MDDKWQKVREIFDAALSRTPEERAAFVIEACGKNESLLSEVESLLASLSNASGFLETPVISQVGGIIQAKSQMLEPGISLNHYEIIEKIGMGGMGEVYLARDKKLNRKVAVKILNKEFSRQESNLNRFVREAKAASALNHPNILVIHEIGESRDANYIVSEFVEGETLRGILRGKKLSLAEILDISIQIAGALVGAHGAKIVHRDIKPENVIVRPDGLVKILDFGLAKLVEQKALGVEDETTRQNETEKGIILGTVSYMSPEQAKGERVDERTDIFSFGVTLYEMITGQTPFAGDSKPETLANLIKVEPPPLVNFAVNVPDDLQRIVSKTLCKKKDERYQTITDVQTDLKDLRDEIQMRDKLHKASENKTLAQQPTRLVKGETTHSQKPENDGATSPTLPISTTETDGTKNKNRKFLQIAALVLALLILSGAGIWIYRLKQNSFSAVNPGNASQLTIWSGLDDFPAMSPDGNSVAYCSDHNGGFEIYVKPLTPGAKEIQLTADGQQNFQPAWSPDGKLIAYYSKQRGGIWIIPATGGEAKQLTDFGSHPAWSPDGKQIAFQSNPLNDLGAFARNALPPSTLWMAQVLGSTPPRQITQVGALPGGHGSPAWSPDGKRIAFEVDTYDLSYIWTVAADGSDARPVFPQTEPPSLGYAPIYAPDGKSILYHSQNGTMFQVLINPETGEAVGETKALTSIAQAPSTVRRVSFSADGKRIAYNVLRRVDSIASVRLQTKTSEAANAPIGIVSNSTTRNNFPVFSPDGARLAYSTCSIGGTGCDVWLANADGTNQTQLTTSENSELLPSWFPDGEQIGYLSDRNSNYSFWAINLNSKREQMMLDAKSNLEYARLSPDGKRIVFNASREGVTNVWTATLSGDGEPKQMTFDKEMTGFSAWSNDGKLLAFQVKRGDDTNIMVMPSEGGTPEQLTFDKGQSWVFGWSPDDDKILFAGLRGGFWNVWWISRATKKQQQLTDYKKLNSFVRYPSWSPKGDIIAYEYSETTGNVWVADLK